MSAHDPVTERNLDGYGAPAAGPPPWDVYRMTPTTVFAVGHVAEEAVEALGVSLARVALEYLDKPARQQARRPPLAGQDGLGHRYRHLRVVGEPYSRWRWAYRNNGRPWDTKLAVKPLGRLE